MIKREEEGKEEIQEAEPQQQRPKERTKLTEGRFDSVDDIPSQDKKPKYDKKARHINMFSEQLVAILFGLAFFYACVQIFSYCASFKKMTIPGLLIEEIKEDL